MTRRSAVSMSANDTACLAWYQGARARRAATSVVGWPCSAYHTTVNDTHTQQAERDGPLDRAAGAVAGLPDAGDLAAFFEQHLHRPAVGVAADQLGCGGRKVGGDQGQVEAVGRVRVAHQYHVHRAGAEHAGPQAGKVRDGGDAAAAVAGHRKQRERGVDHAGQHLQVRQPGALDPWSAPSPGRWWCQLVQRGVAAQPGRHRHLGGQPGQRLAGVGGVADQVDATVGKVGADEPDQLAGQVELGAAGLAGPPQPGQDRQAHRPVGHKRQVDPDPDHDPAVGPRDRLAALAADPQRVVMPGGGPHLAARAAVQGVVDHQPQRTVAVHQPRADHRQQRQTELVGRPACGREEPVRPGVVPASHQPRADKHPADGPRARLGHKPRHQPAEGGEGRRGEAATKAGEQVHERGR